jgi:general secretion pathway protein K
LKDREQKIGDRGQNGSAIIITVLIVTILVALVVEFAYEVYIDTAALSNWTDAQKASLIAKSGQAICSNYIKMIKSDNILSEVEFPVERDLGKNTQLIIKIEDENAKFNINSIINQNGTSNKQTLALLQKLFEYLNINTKLADAIADWTDSDSEPIEGLSDSENNAKNALLQSIDEIKLIPGIDKNTFDKISPFITVYGDKTLNVNTAKLPVLMSLRDDMTETLAQRIIDYRETTPFDKSFRGQLSNLIGINILVSITYNSSNYRVTSKATVNEITRVIESVVDGKRNKQFWREQ